MALSQVTFEFGNDSQKKNEDKNILPESLLPQKSKRGRKSLKEMGIDADLIEIPEDEILFKKQYYSIGDVAAMFKENTSLIRYWENEFSILNFHYLIATIDTGVRYFEERHEVRRTSTKEMFETFKVADFDVTFDEKGLTGRGMYYGIKKNNA